MPTSTTLLYQPISAAEAVILIKKHVQSYKDSRPPILELNFRHLQIGDEDVRAIAKALQSGKCPPGLKLDFCHNKI